MRNSKVDLQNMNIVIVTHGLAIRLFLMSLAQAFWSNSVLSLSKTRSLYGSDAFYGMKKENRGPKL